MWWLLRMTQMSFAVHVPVDCEVPRGAQNINYILSFAFASTHIYILLLFAIIHIYCL